MTEWFYQIRIFVTSDLWADLRSFQSSAKEKLYDELVSLKLEDILDIKLIDPNPANNPQLPQATCYFT